MSSDGPSPGPTQGLPPSRPHQYTFRRFRIRVTSGRDQGLEATSEASEFCIGTAKGNQLVLTDPTVSRHHCVITATAEGFLLRDLGSRNGTTLSGCRLTEIHLRSGVQIGLGETTLRFDGLEEEISEPLSEQDRYGPALGRSPAMRRIFAVLPRIAASDSTILLEGETGTGKTLLAEAIHQASPRKAHPFVVVDCGAIAPTLIESRLFGHEKGAFTGADRARVGAIQAAQAGTLFLDEIGELPLEMQPKLLTALDQRVITRLGSSERIRVDVRVIAATNRDLREMVNRATFRSDLYYRLDIVRLRIPPLRERPDDIVLLVEHFYEQLCGEADPRPPDALIAAMVAQPWLGNVRQLRNAVERALLLGDSELWKLSIEDQPPAAAAIPRIFDPSVPYRTAKERMTADWERWYLGELLRRHKGKLRAAAIAARTDRGYLRELLRRHNLIEQDRETDEE